MFKKSETLTNVTVSLAEKKPFMISDHVETFNRQELGMYNILWIYYHWYIIVRNLHIAKDCFESNSCWLIYSKCFQLIFYMPMWYLARIVSQQQILTLYTNDIDQHAKGHRVMETPKRKQGNKKLGRYCNSFCNCNIYQCYCMIFLVLRSTSLSIQHRNKCILHIRTITK